jgi:hypothetical protein
MKFIPIINKRHSAEMKNMEYEWNVEKSRMRKRMRGMYDEILSQQEEPKRKQARRMTESTGSEEWRHKVLKTPQVKSHLQATARLTPWMVVPGGTNNGTSRYLRWRKV